VKGLVTCTIAAGDLNTIAQFATEYTKLAETTVNQSAAISLSHQLFDVCFVNILPKDDLSALCLYQIIDE
jgi:hypothetical protein